MRECRLGIVMSALVIGTLVGCGTSPEPRFYTLSTGETPTRASDKETKREYIVAVGPVTMPELVDRPELVVRVGANQVALLEQHRWAEPLRSEVARAVAENLGSLLHGSQVITYLNSTMPETDYRVLLDIQRFDSTLGEAVMIDAFWTIRPSTGKEPKTGRSVVQEFTIGKDYEALVAAHVRALHTLSSEIADAIRSSIGGGAK
jgi:uncharacterized lipoprotein YmbA